MLIRAKRTFGAIFARRLFIQELLESSHENDISAGAFEGCFALQFDRNVAFPPARICFMLSDARVTSASVSEASTQRGL